MWNRIQLVYLILHYEFCSKEVADDINFASDISTSQALLSDTVSLPVLICLTLALRTACNSYLIHYQG